MKRKVVLGMLLCFLHIFTANAQVETAQVYRNGLKLNTMGLVFHNVSLLYERSLNDHWTLQMGTGYRWGG